MLFFDNVLRILGLYIGGPQMPKPRAFALRHLEEAVELALICGANVKDTYVSVQKALSNEQRKDPTRRYEDEVLGSKMDIAAEIADVTLLAACIEMVAHVTEADVEAAADRKVERLLKAAADGTLHFEPDGRFYRRDKAG
jgi:hypothetical protein